MSALVLGIALLAARVALPFDPVEGRAGPPRGRVVDAARGLAFLDAGARDGLAPGLDVEILRDGAPVGRCRVEAVADRSAACRGEGLRAGDAYVPPEPPPAPPPPEPVPGPLADSEAAGRRAAIEAAATSKVAAKPLPVRVRRGDAEAGVAAVYFHGGAAARHEGRVHGRIHGAPFGRGLRLDVELSSVARTAGADASAFRTGDAWLLELREAAVSSEGRDGAVSFAAGRILPRQAPGAGRIDGARASWRLGRVELGAYGGAMPDPITTEPTARRATAGLFAAAGHARRGLFLREEGRIAWVRTPELGHRLEVEGAGSLGLARALDLSVRGRFGAGGEARAQAGLDEARVDLGARLGAGFALSAGLRYVGLEVPESPLPVAALFPGPSRRADAAISWTRGGWLTVSLRGAGVRDVRSGLERAWAGPEIHAWLLGRRLGLHASYLEEGGWLSGRSLSLGASSSIFPRLRMHLRGGLFQDERLAPLPALLEAGGSGGVEWDVAPWLELRATALVRHSVTTGSDLGGRAFVELVGRR